MASGPRPPEQLLSSIAREKICEEGINRDMFLLRNISGGITGDYIF